MGDRAIVSLHEKGFWQADLYLDASHLSGADMEQMGLAPDGFATFKTGGEVQVAIDWVRKQWPNAELVVVEDDDEAEDDE